jgi:NlpC/P60 family putative phage cell wall peptidase
MTEAVCGIDDARAARGEMIVALARSWIGTPYRHQASCRGSGADCLGLVRGVWRDLFGEEPETVPPYRSDWSETGEEEVLIAAAERHLIPVGIASALPGDVLVMRMLEQGLAKHAGILARAAEGYPTLIHAYSGHGVVESPLTPAWLRRVAAAFRFPETRWETR